MPIEIEFASKTDADAFRDDHAEHVAETDDRRTKTVRFTDDTPEWLIEQAETAVIEGRGEREGGFGQVALTDHERSEIDFSEGRANVPHARSVKAALTAQGVGDWLANYDSSLTVDEHVSTVAETGRGGGERRDRDEDDPDVLSERGRSAARAQGEECNHAEGHCRHGDPEACEFLGEACGFSESEIEAIMAAEVEEAEATGEPVDVPFTGPQLGALRRSWQGYKGAIHALEQALDRVRAAEQNATDAMAAINSIRAGAGQEPLDPRRLNEIREMDMADVCSSHDRTAADVMAEREPADEPLGAPPVDPEPVTTHPQELAGTGLAPSDLDPEVRAEFDPDVRPEERRGDLEEFENQVMAEMDDEDALADFRRASEKARAKREEQREARVERDPDQMDVFTAAETQRLGSFEDECDDPLPDPGGIGGGRRRTLEAIERKDRLEPVQSFNSIDDMTNAVHEINLDPERYLPPPTSAIETLRNVYETLPDEAKQEYLNDDTLHRRINAARRQFNEWLGRLRREKEIPSPVEAGPSNYPTQRARDTSRLERESKEELDETLRRIESGARGGRQRALEAIGSSVAEQNQEAAESLIERRREEWEPGDIVLYRNPNLHAGAIVRLNKKSVRVQRRDPFGDGEFVRETIDLDSDFLRRVPPEDLPNLAEQVEPHGLDRDQTVPPTLEAAQRQMLGEEQTGAQAAA